MPDALHFRVAREQRAAQRAALRGAERRGRHACGLVDDHELGALQAQVERQLGFGLERRGFVELDRDPGTHVQQRRFFGALTIDAHLALSAKLRRLVPSDSGDLLTEELVESVSAVGRARFQRKAPRGHHKPCSPRLMNERVPREGLAGSMLK